MLAERQLGATVHVLDDGFQHLQLARDLDILVTSVGEIPNGRVIPFGRLREPIGCGGARARAGGVGCDARARRQPKRGRSGSRSRAARCRTLGDPVAVGDQRSEDSRDGSKVLAVAGIAHPEQFVHVARGRRLERRRAR